MARYALHDAAIAGDVEHLRELLAASDFDLDQEDLDGRTPLRKAITWRKWEVVDALITAGTDVKARDRKGRTPLHSACFRARLHVVQRLIDLGADVNARDFELTTPLTMLLWLANAGDPAVASRQRQVFDTLVAAGADFKTPDASGRTPLHWACRTVCPKVARRLIELGADIEARALDGNTPLLDACAAAADPQNATVTTWRGEVCDALLTAGADVRDCNTAGSTALHSACASRHHELVHTLLAGGSLVDAQDPELYTPLMRACRARCLEAVATLLHWGAKLDPINDQGNTVLDYSSNDISCVMLSVLEQKQHFGVEPGSSWLGAQELEDPSPPPLSPSVRYERPRPEAEQTVASSILIPPADHRVPERPSEEAMIPEASVLEVRPMVAARGGEQSTPSATAAIAAKENQHQELDSTTPDGRRWRTFWQHTLSSAGPRRYEKLEAGHELAFKHSTCSGRQSQWVPASAALAVI